jgi:DNA-binding Lrp family transcriptional regulator
MGGIDIHRSPLLSYLNELEERLRISKMNCQSRAQRLVMKPIINRASLQVKWF